MTRVEINRDCELDFDGEVGPDLDVFWAEGHGHDEDEIIDAVIKHCLGWDSTVPRIDSDDRPVEVWQQDVECGDSVEYRREPEIPAMARYADWRPVTVLDLERKSRGATKCSVNGCTRPWNSGQPVQIVQEVDGPYVAMTMWLCREHARQIPDPSYRLRFIPVEATIMLPGEGNQTYPFPPTTTEIIAAIEAGDRIEQWEADVGRWLPSSWPTLEGWERALAQCGDLPQPGYRIVRGEP